MQSIIDRYFSALWRHLRQTYEVNENVFDDGASEHLLDMTRLESARNEHSVRCQQLYGEYILLASEFDCDDWFCPLTQECFAQCLSMPGFEDTVMRDVQELMMSL